MFDEFLTMYKWYKERRESVPSKEDLYLEMIKVFYDSTTKSDQKRSAKLILKNKGSIQECGFWKFIDTEELQSRLM